MKKQQRIIIIWWYLLATGFALLSTILSCTNPTKPLLHPIIKPMADTTLRAGDTATFAIQLEAPAEISFYTWNFIGSRTSSDTTYQPRLCRNFTFADTGISILIRKAHASNGLISNPDTAKVSIRAQYPRIGISGDSVITQTDSISIRISRLDSLTTPIIYYWALDSMPFTKATSEPSLFFATNLTDTGIKTISTFAKTPDGRTSDTLDFRIQINQWSPQTTILGSTTGFVKDSTTFTFIGTDSHHIPLIWEWSFDSGATFTTITQTNQYKVMWNDTGMHTIAGRMKSKSGLTSPLAYFSQVVTLDPPRIHLAPSDSSVFATDSIRISAQTLLSKRPPVSYEWHIDNTKNTWVTKTPTFTTAFAINQTGSHFITCTGIDSRGIYSPLDSSFIQVRMSIPTISVPRDTLIALTDTLGAFVQASDSAGAITKYLWNTGTPFWAESASIPTKKIFYQGVSQVKVIAGAQNRLGIIALDSFVVTFNRPPNIPLVTLPCATDTLLVRYYDSTFDKGVVPFAFFATDPDGNLDSIRYKLSLGKNQNALPTLYSGRAQAFTATQCDTGTWYYRLAAFDLHGDSSIVTGSFHIILQKSICFFGHSISVGFGQDPNQGGYRRKLIDSLRSYYSRNQTVRAVGPLLTGFMTQADDSCISLGSTNAGQMATLCNQYTNLNADIWVIFFGVNHGYDSYERDGIRAILSTIYNRNPRALMYIFGSLPYAYGYYGMYWLVAQDFNDSIRAIVADRNSQGYNVHMMDVYYQFAASDSTYLNPAMFAPGDILHPNQRGYDTCSSRLYDSIKVHGL